MWEARSVFQSACEVPNVVLAVAVISVLVSVHAAYGFRLLAAYVLAMSLLAPALGLARIAKQVLQRLPDIEFRTLMTREAACHADLS